MPTGQRVAVPTRWARGGRRGTSGRDTPRPCAITRPPARQPGTPGRMLPKALYSAGLRSWLLHGASFGAVGLCIGLWIRAKTVDQDERGNAERRALFVGLWPPMLWLIGDALTRGRRRSRLTPRG